MVFQKSKLGHVQLSEKHRARRFESLHSRSASRGHIPMEDPRRATRRLNTLRVEKVLYGDWNAMQWTELSSVHHRLLCPTRRLRRPVRSNVQIAVNLGIELFDASQETVD